MRRSKGRSEKERLDQHVLFKKGNGFARAWAWRAGTESGKTLFIGSAASLTMTLLAGCAMGPDFIEPAPPPVTGYTKEPLKPSSASDGSGQGQGQRFAERFDIEGQWWEIFHSRPLNDLIADALKHNPDIQSAQAGLRVAHETTEAQRGAFAPTVAPGYNTFTQRASTIVSPPSSSAVSPYLTLNTAQVDVGYTPDVFGLIGREVENTWAAELAQRYQVEATYLTLTSNVVNGAIQEASLRGQIVATKKIIKIEKDLLELIRTQKKLGQAAEADVALQEAAVAQAEQTLPPLDKALLQQRDLLTALAGRYPSDEVAEKFTLEALRLPRELPVSLPSKLVEQRPDVAMASANLHQASASIGVAIANRMPLINLTANLSTAYDNLGTLFAPYANGYLLTAAVTVPVFDGFTLYHKQREAEAAYDQAEAQYRSTAITAFQNVADTLRAIQTDAQEMSAAVKAEDAAFKSLTIVRKQLEFGQVSTLAVLTAEQTYLSAVLTRIQALASRYSDTAALFQALGGGWWNRKDIPPAEEFDPADVLRFTEPPPPVTEPTPLAAPEPTPVATTEPPPPTNQTVGHPL
ncbi:MAG TPA: efflux transporter outer membrane subunit [Methylocella sp.]|nr:efflux transporter outer membrane subunit [Methylocella sp.]